MAHEELFATLKKEDKINKFIDYMSQTETHYLDAASALKQRIVELTPLAPVEANRPINVEVNIPFRFDELINSLPKFDGRDLTEWPSFRDRFLEQLHNEDKIKPAQKLQLLKQLLTGEAANVLSGCLLTQTGYEEAWDRLNQRFNDKYVIRRAHLRKFLRISTIRGSPTGDDLQQMSNITNETMRQLKSQDLPVEHWNLFIVHCLHERLDPETARQWELQRVSDEPTAKQMLEFIEKQANALKNSSSGRTSNINAKVSGNRRTGQTSDIGDKENAQGRSSETNRKAFGCSICRANNHQIWECPKYNSLSFRARREFVDRSPICPNCLKYGHKENDCFQQPCVRCPGRPYHNILLCPSKEVNKQTASAYRVQGADPMALVQKKKSKDKTD